MGLCISGEKADYEGIVRYDGQTCLGVRHGEGTYLYQFKMATYTKDNGNGTTNTGMVF